MNIQVNIRIIKVNVATLNQNNCSWLEKQYNRASVTETLNLIMLTGLSILLDLYKCYNCSYMCGVMWCVLVRLIILQLY